MKNLVYIQLSEKCNEKKFQQEFKKEREGIEGVNVRNKGEDGMHISKKVKGVWKSQFEHLVN